MTWQDMTSEIVSTGFYSGTAATGTADITSLLFPAPFGGITVTQAWAYTQDAVAANASNTLDVVLINAGTAGTATTAIGTAAAAGTAGWAANTVKTITLNCSADELTCGPVAGGELRCCRDDHVAAERALRG